MPRAPVPPRKSPTPPAIASGGGVLGLRQEDFDARADAARTDFVRRLALWAAAASSRLRAVGLDLDVCIIDDTSGARALFLARGSGLHEATAVLALRLTVRGIRAGLEFSAAGIDTLKAIVSDPSRAPEMATALEALPEQFELSVEGTGDSVRAAATGAHELRALLARADEEQRALWLGWALAPPVAVEHAALVGEQLEDALVALSGVYRVLIAGDEFDEGAVSPRGRPTGGRRLTSRHAQRDDEREPTRGRMPSSGRRSGRERTDSVATDTDADREPAGERSGETAISRSLRADHGARGGGRRRTAASKPQGDAPIERGTRVRVLEGPFSGKVGVVQALDGKGRARVMLGLLAVHVDIKNLTAHTEGRYRPVLGTSHRKPSPVRS